VQTEAIQVQSDGTQPNTGGTSMMPLATQAGKVVDQHLRAAGWTFVHDSRMGFVRYRSPDNNCAVEVDLAHQYSDTENNHFKAMKGLFTLTWFITPADDVHEYLMRDGTKMFVSMFAGKINNYYATGNIWVAYKNGWAQEFVEYQNNNCTLNAGNLISVNAIRAIGGGELEAWEGGGGSSSGVPRSEWFGNDMARSMQRMSCERGCTLSHFGCNPSIVGSCEREKANVQSCIASCR
jgi:hypothetical protein